MSTKIIIVNDDDEIIWFKERTAVLEKDVYRVSGLRITNLQWDILLAQRAFTKKHDPGKRGAGVAGTNDEWETYVSNIIKEAKEELGLDIDESMIVVWKKVKNIGTHNFFCQRFFLTIDKKIEDFVIPEDEVIALQRMSKNELVKKVLAEPEYFTENAQEMLRPLGLL